MADDPRTAAWRRVLDALKERRDTYAAEGYDVTTAIADHGAATVDDGTGRLVFTVADDDADDAAAAAEGATFPVTNVEYADVEGHRLFLLAALDPGSETGLLVAGGVERDAVAGLRDAAGLRTVLRRADGTRVVVLEHETVGPFVDDL